MEKAKSVDSLLSLSGEAFVRALYATLLNRDPDDESLESAVRSISTGLDKRDLLVATALSEEARGKAWPLEGLPQLLSAARRERMPVFGFFFRLKFMVSRVLQQVNRAETRLAYIESQVSYRLVKIESDIYNLHKMTSEGLGALSQVSSAARLAVEGIAPKISGIEKDLDVKLGDIQVRLDALNEGLLQVTLLRDASQGAFSELWLKLNHMEMITEKLINKTESNMFSRIDNLKTELSEIKDITSDESIVSGRSKRSVRIFKILKN